MITQNGGHGPVSPHGGTLVWRILGGEERKTWLERSIPFPVLHVDSAVLSDLLLIATGAFSPLTGFMTERDYLSVRDEMRLANGEVWTIPVTLPAPEERAEEWKKTDFVTLADFTGKVVAILRVESVYRIDPLEEAKRVYLTTDPKHPGVARLLALPLLRIGGEIRLLNRPSLGPLAGYCLDPGETRSEFADRGWRTVVGFQTRNPIHRAHEYIQKAALEIVDGLLLHPLVGETKADDIPAGVRMKSYEVLLEHYYPKERVLLAGFPAAMRYAGPREAVFHAIVRKNYGCTHFIVGRDHAGVGDYYGTYDAQRIFDHFSPGELGIVPLKFEHSFFCRRCAGMASRKTCPHTDEHRVHLSGTRVRRMLREGEFPPPEFSRPEVIRVLIEGLRREENGSRQWQPTPWTSGICEMSLSQKDPRNIFGHDGR
jgi:sulfate adenylyltransferase